MHQLTRKRALTLTAAGAIAALTPAVARGQTATIRLGQNAADTFGEGYAVFASGSLYDSAAPTTQFCVAANSPFRTPKDLEGQTIAVPALTSLSSMKIDVDVIRKMVRVGYATSFQPQMMQPVLDTAFAYGGLTRHVEAGELSAPPKS